MRSLETGIDDRRESRGVKRSSIFSVNWEMVVLMGEEEEETPLQPRGSVNKSNTTVLLLLESLLGLIIYENYKSYFIFDRMAFGSSSSAITQYVLSLEQLDDLLTSGNSNLPNMRIHNSTIIYFEKCCSTYPLKSQKIDYPYSIQILLKLKT